MNRWYFWVLAPVMLGSAAIFAFLTRPPTPTGQMVAYSLAGILIVATLGLATPRKYWWPYRDVAKRGLGGVSLVFGSAIVLWFLYNQVWPTREFKDGFRSIFQLALPIGMIWIGWRWLTDAGAGVEEQDIDIESPELVASVAEAKRTLATFKAEVEKHIDGAYLKFPLVTDKGVTEHIWAYVHHYADGVFNVSLANAPYTQEGEIEPRRDVNEAEVEDWQIMLPDGRSRGAYSLAAAFRYLDRIGVRSNRTMRKQRAQLIDAAEQAATDIARL